MQYLAKITSKCINVIFSKHRIIYEHNQWQSLTKSSLKACPEDTRYRAFTREKNTYVRTWELKRGEGACSKEVYFRELVVWETIDNKALKRDWKQTKNLRANSGKTPMTSHQIFVAVSTKRCTIVHLPHRSPHWRFWCIYWYIYHGIYNILVENCTMHSCELIFMQCRNAKIIGS